MLALKTVSDLSHLVCDKRLEEAVQQFEQRAGQVAVH